MNEWQGQINPLTGQPFQSQEEWDQFQQAYDHEGGGTGAYDPGGVTPGTNENPNVAAPPSSGPGSTDLTSWWNPADPQGSFMRWAQGRSPNSATLANEFRPYLEAVGGHLENANNAGIVSKAYFPGMSAPVRLGNYFDGGGTPSWGWTVQTGGGGGTPINPNTMGSLLDPFPGEFTSVAGKVPTLDLPAFVMPTGADALKADPGFQFRVDMGKKALLGSRAAQGIVNTGGTMKDLIDYGENAGSQEYGNFFDRSVNTYNTNASRAKDVYNAAYKNYLDQYNMFRQRQQDTNQYLTDQQRIGLQANA